MKKTLLLLRHAKAEEPSKMFKDFDRELTSQGIMDAARLGHHLKADGTVVDQIKTSRAARTYQTVKVIAEQLKFDIDAIEQTESLYDGGMHAYLAAVNATSEQVSTLLLCGHNPDISYFAEYLTRTDVGSMQKCSQLTIEFEDLTWAEVSGRTGKISRLISPQLLKDKKE